MRVLTIFTSFATALVLTGCASTDSNKLSMTYLEQFAAPEPTITEFPVCHGFGCSVASRASLTANEWKRVGAIFKPPAKDAAAERQRIARAVALMQILAGQKTGTAVHQWTHKNMEILPHEGDFTQFDCIDEAVNTWTYMTMMERDGLFRFNHVAKLAHVGDVTTINEVRNAAVLQDKSGEYFAIDPSLVDHGVPAPIMPLKQWTGTWPPKITLAEASVDPGKLMDPGPPKR